MGKVEAADISHTNQEQLIAIWGTMTQAYMQHAMLNMFRIFLL